MNPGDALPQVRLENDVTLEPNRDAIGDLFELKPLGDDERRLLFRRRLLGRHGLDSVVRGRREHTPGERRVH